MITEVGIAGSGIMGSAIATINLQAGYDIVIFDSEESQLLKAKCPTSSARTLWNLRKSSVSLLKSL